MNNFFVIVFMIVFNVDGVTEEALIQYAGTRHFHDTKEQCEQYAAQVGRRAVIDEFLKQVPPGVELLVTSDMHCTLYDIRKKIYPDYPEFNFEPGEIPSYQQL